MAPNARTAAIYYFITALFILLACFDTYFALPINVRLWSFILSFFEINYELTVNANGISTEILSIPWDDSSEGGE